MQSLLRFQILSHLDVLCYKEESVHVGEIVFSSFEAFVFNHFKFLSICEFECQIVELLR